MDQPEEPNEVAAQPRWTEDFQVEGDEAASSKGRVVRVTITHELEVSDEAVLREAVEELYGPPQDDIDRHLREHPANLIGLLLSGPLSLPHLPGVQRRGTGMGVDDRDAT